MPGQSGAIVKVEGDIAYKRGVTPASAAATVAQGEWLSRWSSVNLPTVHMVFNDGYAMERLRHLPVGLTDWEAVTGAIVDALQDGVWDYDDVRVDWDAHQDYVIELTGRYGLSSRVLPMFREVIALDEGGYLQGTNVLHGDPTFSNTMLRGGYHYDVVLIDPIPTRPQLPSLRASDVGKVLQSAYGYEAMRFGWPEPDRMACECMALACLDSEEEQYAAVYFAIFHLLRAMKYADKPHVKGLMDIAKATLDRAT